MDKRTIVFRADGGPSIGMGHFIRTLALAEMLNDDFYCIYATQSPTEYQKNEINNVCQERIDLPSDESHFEVFLNRLKGNEIVVLDNYYFNTDYQRAIKDKGCNLVCIDDLHDKESYADLIINHALGVCLSDYRAQPYTKFALGPDYVLLRKVFLEQAKKPKVTKEIKTVFICFGGLDDNDLTKNALIASLDFDQLKEVIVITGPSYKYLDTLKVILDENKKITHYHAINQELMLALMLKADFAIVPASGILYEVLATKIPVITGAYINNQKIFLNDLSKHKFVLSIEDFSIEKIRESIKAILNKNDTINHKTLFDGLSGERILTLFSKLNDNVFIITGANRGLGKALSDALLNKKNSIIVSISRNITSDQLDQSHKNRFYYINQDLSKDIDYAKLKTLNEIISISNNVFYINNASTIKPIEIISKLDDNEIEEALKVNVSSPIILIKYLLANFSENRISFINITSGAANKSISHWSMYSASKAFINRFFEILKEENINNKYNFISIDPGIIDTEMQLAIRSSEFPMQHIFKEAKDQNKLLSPAEVAERILNILGLT